MKRRHLLRGLMAATAFALAPVAFNQTRISPAENRGYYRVQSGDDDFESDATDIEASRFDRITSGPVDSVMHVWLNGEELVPVGGDASRVLFGRQSDGVALVGMGVGK